jgi:CRP-like cAMP-binding protein
LEPKQASKGQTVITQGRDGSHLYLVKSGKYKCQKDGNFLKWYTEGEVFGELALLYGAKRQASIFCVEAGELYSLDRETLNSIVSDELALKRTELKQFVSKLDLFRSIIDEYQLNKICDAFERETRPAGAQII